MAKSASGPTLLSHIQRNRLTPRSAEACRRTGVEPSELMPLPVSAFRETGMPPEVEKLKWAEYEALRMEAYETVQSERERVIEERSRGVGVLAGDGDAGTLSSGSLAARPSTATANEQRMLEKMQKRQQAEVEQMLMHEVRTARLNHEKAERAAATLSNAERAQRERTQRHKEQADARRAQEMSRRQEEVAQEKEARRRQRYEMEREARREAKEAEDERARQQEIVRRDAERSAKAAARKAQQEANNRQLQLEAELKARRDAEREEDRARRLEEKREADWLEKQQKASAAARRVTSALAAQAAKDAARRSLYLDRKVAEEARWARFKEEKKQRAIELREAGEARQRTIRAAQNSMEVAMEGRKLSILEKEREHAAAYKEAEAERQRQQALALTRKDMRVYSRQLKLARQQRKDEYRRELFGQKVKLESLRTDELLSRRQEMLKERKAMRASAVIARQQVTEKMDRMRKTSTFEVDEGMRNAVTDPELSELLVRCDAASKGTGKVDVQVMQRVLSDMEGEGKLKSLGRDEKKSPPRVLKRPASTGSFKTGQLLSLGPGR